MVPSFRIELPAPEARYPLGALESLLALADIR